MLRPFWKYYLKRNRWKIIGEYPRELPKVVVIVAPHTSGWDFIMGVAVRSVLRLQHIRFLGKQELFRPPFGFIFRWLGGTPVDRFSNRNMVEQVVDRFNAADRFSIALSPEGTRQRVDRLRTGFYHIARGAGAALLMVGLDFERREVIIAEPFYPSDEAKDMRRILSFFGPIRGRDPEKDLGHLAKAMGLPYSRHSAESPG